jgi:hypothetical protein
VKHQLNLLRWAALALLIASPTGCENSLKRYSVSGGVTLGGNPVKAGEVAFEPDSSKGNRGPGSVARIKDGKYATEPGMGIVGGAYVVRIIPLTGVPSSVSMDGEALLPAPYEVRVEFPSADSTRDFDIPSKGK